MFSLIDGWHAWYTATVLDTGIIFAQVRTNGMDVVSLQNPFISLWGVDIRAACAKWDLKVAD